MKYIVIFILFALLNAVSLCSFSQIEGRIKLDTLWNSVVYLSHIPELDKMNHMSHQMIIAETAISSGGYFRLNTSFLTNKDQLYRIHVTKKGYSAASLIIGSNEENHFFVIAKKNAKISIDDSTYTPCLSDVAMSGYLPNIQFQQIRQWVKYADTISYEDHGIKREFIKKALSEKMLEAADTSKHPLVALYALSESNYQQHAAHNPEFYQQFFKKWSEQSIYFTSFKQKLDIPVNSNQYYHLLIALIAGFIVGLAFHHFHLIKKKTSQSNIEKLTIQERKILNSLKEGKSNKEISQQFNIGMSTVKSHVNSIYSKIKVKSRKEIFRS